MRKLITTILSLIIAFSCSNVEQNTKNKNDYLEFSKNSLDYHITPKQKFDKDGLMFSDQGAWFAYGLPDTEKIY